MATPKNEPHTNPVKCICGKMPVIVKTNGKTMCACPDLIHCGIRGRWAKGEQAAIEDWYIAVNEAKNRRKERKRHGES